MRWFVLLAVLGGIFWTANWSYHLLDHAVLITDYWESQGGDESWQLVNYIEGKPHLYTFAMTNAYSGAIQPPIPGLSGHPFRFKPDTISGINQPFFALTPESVSG